MGQKLIHKHSNVQGKLPSGNTLEHGEIAVNYNSTEPFISIRKDDNEYARFIDESAVDAKIKNANDTIQNLEKEMLDNEEVVASALTDLDSRLNNKSEIGHNHDDLYVTEAQVDDKIKNIGGNVTSRIGFGKIQINDDTTTIDADLDVDTLTIAQGNGITLTQDITNDKFTISVTDGVFADKEHFHDEYLKSIPSEYVTESEVNELISGKAEADHNHDGIYMTEAQVDDKLNDKTYDDRYYTESEVDVLLNGKADIDHNHDDEYVTDAEVDDKLKTVQNSVNELEALVEENEIVTANALTDLDSRLNTKADVEHNHDGVYMTEAQVDDKLKDKNYDDRYYTESEVDILLNDKSDADHNHDGAYMTETQVDDKVKTVQNSLEELKQGVIDNELVTANALNDLDGRLNTKADAEHNHDDLYYTQAQVDERFRNIGEDVSSRMAFGKIQVNTNSTTIDADAASDTLIIAQGNGITLTQDTANDKITVSVTENVFAEKEHSHDEYLKSIPSEYVTDGELNTKLNSYQPTITDLSDIRNNASTAVSWGNHAEQNYTKTGHEHQSSAITDSITTSNGITSTATGLVEGKAVYEYAQPKGSYQPAGDYAASSHNHKKADITDFAHDHDDRYYTESEINTLLGGKSNTGHVHTKSEITDFAHDHDDRYYTEDEVNNLLGGKSNTGHNHKKADITDFAHTHSKSEITDFAHNHGTLTLTGDVSGSATINNTNTTVTVTVSDDSHNHKASNISDFTSAVDDRINTKLAANDAMLFKGTLGTNGTITSLPATHNAGWTYKVITAGTYAGQKCEVGDLVMCITDGTAASDSHWTVVQTNTDGHVTGPANATSNEIAIFDGTTGKLIKGSGYETGSFATKGHGHGTLSVSGDVSGSASINSGGTSISLSYNKSATTSQAGVVQLSDSVSSSASTKAATEKAVKTAYDKGVEAYNLANGKWTKTTATSGATGISKLITGDVNGKTYADGEAAAAAHTHSQYANQNAFSNVVVGSTTISADNATDTLTLAAGTNITLTPDANSDKITINGPDLSGYLKSHQTIYNLTASAGTFSAVTFDPNGAAATINVPTHTSHLTNNSGYITSGTTVKNAQNADKVNNLTVATAVPANAVFTDSKVTSADNHYQANTALTATTTASGGSGTPGFGGEIKVPSITFDKRGHYISATTTTYTLPSNPNTDTATTKSGHYNPGSTATTMSAGSGKYISSLSLDGKGHVTGTTAGNLPTFSESYKGTVTSVTVQGSDGLTGSGTVSSSGTITLSHADTNTNISADTSYGPSSDVTQSAKNTATFKVPQITLDKFGHVKSVTERTIQVTDTDTNTDTNTHYTTRLYAGASGTASNAATSNPYLKVTDDNTYRNQVRFVGGGSTSVSSDASGTITISSTDTNTDTKVTSVGNHYTPSSSTTIGATSGNNYIRGLYVDAAGHVTSVATGTPTDTNTNTWRPITDTWNGTATDTSVSQKGVTAAFIEATEYADGVYDTVINIFDTHGVKYDDILTTASGEFCGLKASAGKVGLSLWDCPMAGYTYHGRWLLTGATIQTAMWGGIPTSNRYYPVTVSYDGYLACYVPWSAGSSSDSACTYAGHYTPTTGNSPSWVGTSATTSTSAIKGIRIDGKGHVLSVASGTTASSASDEKVKSVTGTSKYYLLGSSSSASTTATTYKHGSVYMSAGTMTCNAYYQGSDERLKDFGDEIEINFDSLKRIPKVYYSWKADDKKEKQIGTSAQKVRDIYPELVGGTDKDMLSVDYARLSVIALKAIDVLHEENEKLRNIIEEMDERIKKLENK